MFGFADVQRSIANVSASQTDSEIVAAQTGASIVVLGWLAQAGGTATNLTFNTKGSGSGTAISPALANGANAGQVAPLNPYGWFRTNAGEALTVTTGSGSATGILVLWVALNDPGSVLLTEGGAWLLKEDGGNLLQE